MSSQQRREKPTVLALISRDVGRLAIALAAIIAIAISANIGSATYVAWSIDQLAAGRPACMVAAPGDGHYRPVERLMDLSASFLRAGTGFGGLVWKFHGVLLVDEGNADPAFHNWSWTRLRFDRGNVRQENVALWPGEDACRPEPGFGMRLLIG